MVVEVAVVVSEEAEEEEVEEEDVDRKIKEFKFHQVSLFHFSSRGL